MESILSEMRALRAHTYLARDNLYILRMSTILASQQNGCGWQTTGMLKEKCAINFVELVNHVLQFEECRRQFFIDISGFVVITSHTDA